MSAKDGRQAPTITAAAEGDPTKDTVETHPAYAQISVSRPTASPGRFLYGSDFRHQHFMSLTIRTSELHRNLSYDRPHPGKQLIEVSMTEAQWASFVSSVGLYSGVQCTLERLQGAAVPGILKTTNRRDQFNAEVATRFQRVEQNLADLEAAITVSGLSGKKQDALLKLVAAAQRDLGPNVEFVASQFGEFMEQTVEQAKIEVNAYARDAVERAGLAALAGAQGGPAQLSAAPTLDVEPDAPGAE